jgi:hypothetical protein
LENTQENASKFSDEPPRFVQTVLGVSGRMRSMSELDQTSLTILMEINKL